MAMNHYSWICKIVYIPLKAFFLDSTWLKFTKYVCIIMQGAKGGDNPHPSNIGDLFSEGSLNPYADDPYAFD